MKLNRDIRLALAGYYCHRNRQRKVIHGNAVTTLSGGGIQLPVPAWDKDADLATISEAAHRGGWALEACAGTFWFRQRTRSGKGIRTIEVHEDDYLDDHKPFVHAVDFDFNE